MKITIPIILSLFIICLTSTYADGCLQPAGRVKVGGVVYADGRTAEQFANDFVSHEDRAYWEKVLVDLEKQKKNYPFLDYRNNFAVALIHLGQVKDAISILEELERQSPGQYVIAANLGTAYELNSENQKALDWIKEGITRSQDSHLGTEWLHVKILEAKLAMEKEPEWLKRHSVLGMDFGTGETPQLPNNLTTDYNGRQKSLAEIEKALVYQLHERLEFIKPPDPMVADLLFDLSNVFAFTRTPEHRKAIYDLALSYGANPAEIIKNRRAVKENVNAADKTQYYFLYGISGVIFLLIIVGLFIIIKKQKLR